MTPSNYKKLREQTSAVVELFSEVKKYNNGEFSHYHLVQKDSLFWFVSKENVTSIPELPSKISEQFLPLFGHSWKKESTLLRMPMKLAFALCLMMRKY